jgi:hypothetical protein
MYVYVKHCMHKSKLNITCIIILHLWDLTVHKPLFHFMQIQSCGLCTNYPESPCFLPTFPSECSASVLREYLGSVGLCPMN